VARLPRIDLPGTPQHVIQRGNNRQVCFVAEQDFAAYAHWLRQFAGKYRVEIHAWVFMTNHVHLLATPHTPDGLSSMMQSLGRQYVRYFNHSYRRSGTLWEGRFKSSIVDAESYLLHCQRYIELNPVRAGMASDPAEYPWSSYQVNALGKESALCKPHEVFLRLGSTPSEQRGAYRELFKAHVDGPMLKEIRDAVNSGMALGNDRFRREIERLTGRRVTPGRPGRKKGNSLEETGNRDELLL
jgi:putative transposase